MSGALNAQLQLQVVSVIRGINTVLSTFFFFVEVTPSPSLRDPEDIYDIDCHFLSWFFPWTVSCMCSFLLLALAAFTFAAVAFLTLFVVHCATAMNIRIQKISGLRCRSVQTGITNSDPYHKHTRSKRSFS